MGKPEQFTVGCLFLFLFLFFHSNKHFRSGLSLTPARRLTIFFFFKQFNTTTRYDCVLHVNYSRLTMQVNKILRSCSNSILHFKKHNLSCKLANYISWLILVSTKSSVQIFPSIFYLYQHIQRNNLRIYGINLLYCANLNFQH